MLSDNIAYLDMRITDVLKKVKEKNYRLKFRREATCLYCFELRESIMPEDFTVDEYHYFRATTNPAEDRMLYAISSGDGTRGFLVDAIGIYMDNVSPAMLHKLELNAITGDESNNAHQV